MSDLYGIDDHKLIYHPSRVARLIESNGEWKEIKNIYPIYVEMSPIGACNHRCSFCAVDYIGYNPVRLDFDILEERLKEMGELGVKSIMYAGEGEPLLHKRIADIARVTKESGIDVAFTTNATVLPKDFLEVGLPNTTWLKASINAGTARTYSKIHKTKERDFFKAIDHLKMMVESRSNSNLDVTLGAQSVLLPENANEMEDLIKICRDEIGLDYLVIKPYSQHMFSDTKEYQDVDYNNYIGREFREKLAAHSSDQFNVVFRGETMKNNIKGNEGRYSKCYATPNLWAYVMADGRVFSCSAFLLDKRFDIGNMKEKTFKEIWVGERRKTNCEYVQNDLDISECRVNCRMDKVNRYLNAIHEKNIKHMNFI